eukprot:3064769-Amphidinium_carterae.1
MKVQVYLSQARIVPYSNLPKNEMVTAISIFFSARFGPTFKRTLGICQAALLYHLSKDLSLAESLVYGVHRDKVTIATCPVNMRTYQAADLCASCLRNSAVLQRTVPPRQLRAMKKPKKHYVRYDEKRNHTYDNNDNTKYVSHQRVQMQRWNYSHVGGSQ